MEGINIDGSVILKWIFKEYYGKVGAGCLQPRIGAGGGLL